MDVYGNSFVYEIGELACISSIKPPLYANHYQNDEDGCVAVDFLHGLLVCGSLKIKKIDIPLFYLQTLQGATSFINLPDLDGVYNKSSFKLLGSLHYT